MGASGSRPVGTAVIDLASAAWSKQVGDVHKAVVSARDEKATARKTRPWETLKAVQPSVMALLRSAKSFVPGITTASEASAALDAALACLEWGSQMVDTRTMLLSLEVLEQLQGLSGVDPGIGADVAKRIKSRKDYCDNFHNAVTLLCSLAYAVTGEAKSAAVNIPNVRWHVARILSGAHSRAVATMPNHIQLKEIKDADFVTRAFVCVAYDLVPDSATKVAPGSADTAIPKAAAATPVALAEHLGSRSFRPSEDDEDHALRRRLYDVMIDDAPAGFHWEAKNSLIVFTGTETADLFWRKHIWLGGSTFGAWGAEMSEEKDGLTGRAHGAWRDMSLHMKPAMIDALRDRDGSTDYLARGSVWVLGHSLGAALATLVVPYVSALSKPPPRIYLSTIAGPRVYDEEACKSFSDLANVRIQRFLVHEDVVPVVPPRWTGFKHVGYPRTLRTPSNVTGVLATLEAHKGVSYRRPFEEFSGADVFAAVQDDDDGARA